MHTTAEFALTRQDFLRFQQFPGRQVEPARGRTLAAWPAAPQRALHQAGAASARVQATLNLETGDLE